ncbi:MAG: hypothetical protein OXC06_02135 [Acidimicrobiaceae bacterium]|nr:hypothetical protein [Acidimicrobiaceae bacterium]
MTDPDDPVLARRRRLSRWATTGKRMGYGLYGLSLAAFAVGLTTGFTTAPATVATVALLVGSVLLLPSIIIGYGVRAADRADRTDDW